MVTTAGTPDRLSQDHMRAMEILKDFQEHLPLTIRRRCLSPFNGPWRPLMDAFVAFEKQAGRSARTIEPPLCSLREMPANVREYQQRKNTALDPHIGGQVPRIP